MTMNGTRISHKFIFMNHSWLFVDIRVASQTYSNTNGHELNTNFSQIIIYEYSRVIRVYSRCVADIFKHE